MEHLSDEELIRNVQDKNCSESLSVLVKRHSGIFFNMTKRYANVNAGCSGISLDDFQDNQAYIVYQAAKKYDPTQGTKFVTWLGNRVRYYCLNTINKESRYYGAEPDKIDFIMDSAPRDDEGKEKILSESSYVIEILDQIKDKRVKKIIQMRYFSEEKRKRSFSFIAKKIGMSTQGIIDLHNNFIEFMRRKMSATDNMDEI